MPGKAPKPPTPRSAATTPPKPSSAAGEIVHAQATLQPSTSSPWVPGSTSPISDLDLHLFNEGTHHRLYGKLGSTLSKDPKKPGTHFAVWAPNAKSVNVMGVFNAWNKHTHQLKPRGSSGIWEGFVPEATKGTIYKYFVESNHNNYMSDRADPFAFMHEVSPATSSVVWDLDYEWNDSAWMKSRKAKNSHTAPMSIYELHIGSWMRLATEGNRSLTYREMAHKLADYCLDLGFTHVEFLPVTEHPFFKSWGYQALGYFAPTSRFGTPQDFMYLVDHLHQRGLGIILDWVPSHFPSDEHGLAYFDGTHLYEHADPRQGYHPDWKSCIFNYGRNEIRAFLISSAMFWMDKYHIDAFRVDAVASMLYLDYSRKDGEWIPNPHGGKENVDAISFMRALNTAVYGNYPDTQMIAEESTAWAMVSAPVHMGGLGFGFKWDMGWMHDTLQYMERPPLYRKYHHGEITFRGLYMFSENYVLPLSHDEVVHMKGSLLTKMPGGGDDPWQKFANLRLLYANQWTQPGKKLLFMGCEIAQWEEFHEERQCEWHLLQFAPHKGVQNLVRALNTLYSGEPAMHAMDCQPDGFRWVDGSNAEHSILCYLRQSKPDSSDALLVVFNFTPEVRHDYRVGVPNAGTWRAILNTDDNQFGGSNVAATGKEGAVASPTPMHGLKHSIAISVPPLACVVFKRS
jgi:1,4-alpha-glucan branching enzyme